MAIFKNVILITQHVFIKNWSTCTDLAIFTDYIYNAVEEGYSIDDNYLA